MSMLAAQDFQGLYAIIPTPSKPGADRADAVDTIDIAETARVVEQLLGDKIDGLIVLGTTGECATITRDEYETFVDCVLGTVRGRVPTFVGATQLGTHEVVHRTRFARDHGADGILLGLPMWQPMRSTWRSNTIAASPRSSRTSRSWSTATRARSGSPSHPNSGSAS